jgi:hypothetical protein
MAIEDMHTLKCKCYVLYKPKILNWGSPYLCKLQRYLNATGATLLIEVELRNPRVCYENVKPYWLMHVQEAESVFARKASYLRSHLPNELQTSTKY